MSHEQNRVSESGSVRWSEWWWCCSHVLPENRGVGAPRCLQRKERGVQGASGCLMELRLAGVASCDVDSGLSASGFYGEGEDGLGLREMEGRLGFRKDEEEWV